jgi:RHS repeat-associated protein
LNTCFGAGREPGETLKSCVNWYDYGSRFYAADLGRWTTPDPLSEKYYFESSYCYVGNNPLIFIDPDGNRKWPVNNKYNGQSPRVDSWYGPRNIKGGSKNHRGLDINFGSGKFDYGAPVLATHSGEVVGIKNTTNKYGRYIILESSDGEFRTSYVHLKKVNVKVGQEITEGQEIGEIGGSGRGKELGYASHLHYGIKVKNPDTGKFEWFNPTEGKGNSVDNIVDPQSWLSSEHTKTESQSDGSANTTYSYSAPDWAKSYVGAWVYFLLTGNDSGLPDQLQQQSQDYNQ